MKWEYTKLFLKVVCLACAVLTFGVCGMLSVLCFIAGFSALFQAEAV